MRILYNVDNMSELLGISGKDVRFLARLGILPALDQSPIRFDKAQIEEWLAGGHWEKHKDRYVERTRGKGLWI